jgi:hypothetical protein
LKGLLIGEGIGSLSREWNFGRGELRVYTIEWFTPNRQVVLGKKECFSPDF